MFKNCLPIVLLTSKRGYSGILTTEEDGVHVHDGNLFIWLAGVYKFSCDYTLSVWIHGRDDFEPTMIKCFSNTVLNMDESANPQEVACSSLTLSPIEMVKLSRSGEISCQVVFH